eukprot:5192939-Amphidinium_carterae.1
MHAPSFFARETYVLSWFGNIYSEELVLYVLVHWKPDELKVFLLTQTTLLVVVLSYHVCIPAHRKSRGRLSLHSFVLSAFPARCYPCKCGLQRELLLLLTCCCVLVKLVWPDERRPSDISLHVSWTRDAIVKQSARHPNWNSCHLEIAQWTNKLE